MKTKYQILKKYPILLPAFWGIRLINIACCRRKDVSKNLNDICAINSQQIKERGGKKNKTTAPVSQQAPHPIAQTPGGIIAKILAYPLDQRTAADNMQFISELKQQITSIL